MSLYNAKYLSKRPFLVIRNTFRPKEHAQTHIAGWGDKNGGQWASFESIDFIDRVRDRDIKNYVVIIDIMEAKVVKNTFRQQHSDSVVLTHYLTKYQEDTKKAISIWLDYKAAEYAQLGVEMPEITVPEFDQPVDQTQIDLSVSKIKERVGA
jgi:hypothetical protein